MSAAEIAALRAMIPTYDHADPPCCCGQTKSDHDRGKISFGNDCPGFCVEEPRTHVWVPIASLAALLALASPQPAPESDATSERADVVAYERGWLDAINALLVECVKRRDAFREAAKTTDREKWAEYLTIAIENDQLCGQLRDRIEDRKNLHVRAKGG